MMYDREGGHFFDLGSAELVADGTVKVRCDALPVAYTPRGLAMSDGSHLEADVIVFATGYIGNLKDSARSLFGDKLGNSLEEFWQCDAEGESRGAWKSTGRKCIMPVCLRRRLPPARSSSMVYRPWLCSCSVLLTLCRNAYSSRRGWQALREVH